MRGVGGALVEHLTASPLMQASRLRAPLNNDPTWVFRRNIIVSLFSMWLRDHADGGVVELYRIVSTSTLTVRGSTSDVRIFTHFKLCLATATHDIKWVKNTHICLIWEQTFPNFDVQTHISFTTIAISGERVRTTFIKIHLVPLDRKRCICHFTKWQTHPLIQYPRGRCSEMGPWF